MTAVLVGPCDDCGREVALPWFTAPHICARCNLERLRAEEVARAAAIAKAMPRAVARFRR